jgi:uncharacterized membrane protein
MSMDQPGINARFDMGRVVKESFAALQKHAVVLIPAAIILVPASQVLSFFALKSTTPTTLFTSPLYWLSVLAAMIAGYLLQAIVIKTVVDGHKGKATGIGEAFSGAFSRVIPLFLLVILYSLGVGLGMILLLVPGMILLVMWSVAAPVVVIEGVGPIAALGRSRALTKGSRWEIFGLFIVAGILSYLLSLAAFGFNFAAMSNPADIGIVQIIASTIVTTFTSVLFACGAAALYTELRLIKEGVGSSELASVFD